jgi:hypothetical protein
MGRISPFIIALVLLFGCVGAFAGDTQSGSDPDATTYQIRNMKYRELLRPRDANSANGTPIVLYPDQPWKCMTWQLQQVSESVFCLKNLFTSKTFCSGADTNALSSVSQVPLGKTLVASSAWQFTRLEDGSYKISDSKSGKVLTAAKSPEQSEARIVVSSWQNLDEQKWVLIKLDPRQLTM